MEIQGARILIAGATGEVGEIVARELQGAGARIFLGGRAEDRLGTLADELDVPRGTFDLREPETCNRLVGEASEALGGLDVVWVATGVTAFGDATDITLDVTRELFDVNVLGPIALIQAALPKLEADGTIVALSAIVADFPTAQMAAYSATKAALSAYIAAVRRERRREGLNVLDVRPQHMATGFSEKRAIAGSPPELPDPFDAREVVLMAIEAMKDGKREVSYDLKARELVVH